MNVWVSAAHHGQKISTSEWLETGNSASRKGVYRAPLNPPAEARHSDTAPDTWQSDQSAKTATSARLVPLMGRAKHTVLSGVYLASKAMKNRSASGPRTAGGVFLSVEKTCASMMAVAALPEMPKVSNRPMAAPQKIAHAMHAPCRLSFDENLRNH
jgi:hypothetical protein